MSTMEIVNKNAIAVELEAKDKRQAITGLARLLLADGAIEDEEAFVDDVFLREQEGQTGIGDGIAIPHGKSQCVKKNCVAVGKLKTPLEWETVDGEPVSVIFLFAVQKDAPAEAHLRMMASVARALAHEDTCRCLKKAQTREEIINIVDQMAAV